MAAVLDIKDTTLSEQKLEELRSMLGRNGNTGRLILSGPVLRETQQADSLIYDPYLKYLVVDMSDRQQFSEQRILYKKTSENIRNLMAGLEVDGDVAQYQKIVDRHGQYLRKWDQDTSLQGYKCKNNTLRGIRESQLKVDRCLNFIVVRKVYHEELIRQLCGSQTRYQEIGLGSRNKQVRQIVNLGCGFDTRPYLQNCLENVDFFEVDTQDVIDLKNKIFEVIGAQVQKTADGSQNNSFNNQEYAIKSKSLKRVPLDLSDPSWIDQLIQNGYEPAKPTLWLLEGVLYYIEIEQVESILKNILDRTSEGSYISFDYANMKNREINKDIFGTRENSAFQFKSAFSDPVDQEFEKLGWSIVDLYSYELLANLLSKQGLEPQLIARTWNMSGIALLCKP